MHDTTRRACWLDGVVLLGSTAAEVPRLHPAALQQQATHIVGKVQAVYRPVGPGGGFDLTRNRSRLAQSWWCKKKGLRPSSPNLAN